MKIFILFFELKQDCIFINPRLFNEPIEGSMEGDFLLWKWKYILNFQNILAFFHLIFAIFHYSLSLVLCPNIIVACMCQCHAISLVVLLALVTVTDHHTGKRVDPIRVYSNPTPGRVDTPQNHRVGSRFFDPRVDPRP